MTSADPYISVVAVSRNDDHGGNLLERMQAFISSLSRQAVREGLNTELIVVEWNPIPDRKRLSQVLEWPDRNDTISTRIITVSPPVHMQFPHSEKMPVFQMIGKNAGIRRARGKFVLATNIDILFSDAMMRYLSKKRLATKHLYRADRYDVDNIVLEDIPENLRRQCTNRVIRVNKKTGTYENAKFWNPGYFTGIVSNRLYRRRIHTRNGFPFIHSNGCGDFTLMSSEDWSLLKGYPEWPIFSWNLDSILLIDAYYRGIREVDLSYPKCIFHIEHSAGSGWTPGIGEKMLFERLEEAGIPYYSWNECLEYSRNLKEKQERGERIGSSNPDSWGLGNFDLEETEI